MGKDLYIGIILIALQNTFGILHHDILLKKKDYSGFKLCNRKLFVFLEEVFFEEGLITNLWSSSRLYFTTTSIFNSYQFFFRNH